MQAATLRQLEDRGGAGRCLTLRLLSRWSGWRRYTGRSPECVFPRASNIHGMPPHTDPGPHAMYAGLQGTQRQRAAGRRHPVEAACRPAPLALSRAAGCCQPEAATAAGLTCSSMGGLQGRWQPGSPASRAAHADRCRPSGQVAAQGLPAAHSRADGRSAGAAADVSSKGGIFVRSASSRA